MPTNERAPDPRPARTRAAIFAAARDLSADDGEITVNALAKRAGVSRAAFYSHFSGLDELMSAMLHQMFETAWTRGTAYRREVDDLHRAVLFGFGVLCTYVERHHAFLRGALEWKFSHLTYMEMVESMAGMHAQGIEMVVGDAPDHLDIPATGRMIASSALAEATHWLVATEEAARAGEELDATGLLETILSLAPAWYTGLTPGQEIPAAEMMGICRAAGVGDTPEQG